MITRAAIREAFRFGIVGGFVFVVDLGMLWFWSGFTPPLVAVSAAYVIAVTVHFCLNKWWVFGNRQAVRGAQVFSYVVAVAACWACTVALFSISRRWITDDIYVAKLIAIVPTALLGFVLMRWMVFRRERPGDGPPAR